MKNQFAACSGAFSFLLCALILLAPVPADAQMDWLKKGQDLLKGSSAAPTATDLSRQEIAAGLKEALRVGTERVVAQLGTPGGFNADPEVHIPLPASLRKARSLVEPVGMAGLFDDLEVKLNRAAEEATPKAKALFSEAISKMTLDDAMEIYKGPDDAATRYFEEKMSAPLADEMRPVIQDSLSQVGAVQAYDAAMGEYRNLPFVPDVKANLTDHVVQEGLDGIFHYLAQEEAAIRQNPAQRTTELLKKVFGGSGSTP